MTTTPGLFAAILVSLYIAHQVADHWVQTSAQAAAKHLPGWPGRLACLRHVTALTAVLAVVLITVGVVTGMRLSLPWFAAGLAVNGVSHYWADRRFTLARLAAAVGLSEFWTLGAPRPGRDDNPSLGGSYFLDQSFHGFMLLVTALIITGGSL